MRGALALTAAAVVCTGFAGHAAAGPRSDARGLVRLWTEANTLCRGGSGDAPATRQACDRRQGYGRRLAALGWCYGRRGEMSYQMRWHRCQANSTRPSN
ncbi:hypothetical protein [Phreatobacter sp. AB_2022a]|uniref:hypothetical protein n=1 Tax=Phreatobacter sp. AB_2022a TaxID=3003134 RepID=UPI0022873D9D|nr:hypothetical protein [Phreatobacter sp. AB_2022a]MCZ0734621.1 hypothetical protein [Phreatobacter sp. AB_2022a]